mmetsp:Transcript_1315/g.5067  ORF Transcript_1315/g.5067 Transcript_1315/m.5067 type:complete len:308 (-) Transcript_1315:63-986(-)
MSGTPADDVLRPELEGGLVASLGLVVADDTRLRYARVRRRLDDVVGVQVAEPEPRRRRLARPPPLLRHRSRRRRHHRLFVLFGTRSSRRRWWCCVVTLVVRCCWCRVITFDDLLERRSRDSRLVVRFLLGLLLGGCCRDGLHGGFPRLHCVGHECLHVGLVVVGGGVHGDVVLVRLARSSARRPAQHREPSGIPFRRHRVARQSENDREHGGRGRFARCEVSRRDGGRDPQSRHALERALQVGRGLEAGARAVRRGIVEFRERDGRRRERLPSARYRDRCTAIQRLDEPPQQHAGPGGASRFSLGDG